MADEETRRKAKITLIGSGNAVTLEATDTESNPTVVTYVLDAFKNECHMHFAAANKEYYVPFHAVDHIVLEGTLR